MSPIITTSRFILRPLTILDISERYLSWLSEQITYRFISAARDQLKMRDLCDYVARREGLDSVLFLGIFTLDGEHIGNIKYEPVDQKLGMAVMGILVGEASWRGKGVAGEVIRATAHWLNRHCGIHSIALGVDVENRHAMVAYQRLGFVEEKTPLIPDSKDGICTMVWRICELNA